ncbi:flagellar basal body P-ring formation chaperone FlgA [Alloyangia pacifica]|uniref:Flagella basal body P-ring formation protein FlgA n=1 Tax=Alloyangia pacifica TaxID=311180 RepID=A0A1I6U0J9_9RHOB|nr:flagellar basal body P-ring formation chaperone FlgA [Alloyangia pacifica]SDH32289.1 flagella basal body P-ring formation protein FlgA [Alloyangia pacifica]SFS94952.1 flagella basal body P-ring formation protein FlgA [Alloyangia pacifica]
MRRALLLLMLVAPPAGAEIVVATRTIRAQEVIAPEAVRVAAREAEGAARTLEAVVGRETRVAVYAGQPLMTAQLAEPALVERNQLVELIYTHAGLRIATEGRALSRGSAGDRIRVMNLSSRNLLVGIIEPGGKVDVSPE